MHLVWAGVIISQSRQRLASCRGIRLCSGEFVAVPPRLRGADWRQEPAGSSLARLQTPCGPMSPANLELKRLSKSSAVGDLQN